VIELADAACLSATDALHSLETSESGLSAAEARRRLATYGPNAVRSHGVRPIAVLGRQLRNPLLLLLLAAATLSGFTSDATDAVIIGCIVTVSVGLGFFNEFRSEQAVEALHSQIRHHALVIRDGAHVSVDVTDLVPGDIVLLKVGDVVPADVRLIEAVDLECDEAVLTGESLPVEKQVATTAETQSCAYMGTIVHQGLGRAVVVRTGANTQFGRIAVGLGERPAETSFQVGLRDFSLFLVRVAGVLTVSIFIINIALHRPLLEALLFSLAIAIGLTPQLLPAIVTVSLSTGSRRLAARKVLVKRLVSIEDLGNMAILFTDKTGTLTEGKIAFSQAVVHGAVTTDDALLLGLVCNEAVVDNGTVVSGNALDVALWNAVDATAAQAAATWHRVTLRPFDHERRRVTVIADDPGGTRWIIVKGEPEHVLDLCTDVTDDDRAALDALYAAGARVIAIARREAPEVNEPTDHDEAGLSFVAFLVFVDRPKADAAVSLERLARLGIEVKVITGDSEAVAQKVCHDIGLDVKGSLTGERVDAMTDDELAHAIPNTTIFARVGPTTKSRIVRNAHHEGIDVAFLGDGVNDALALHHADVGISVDGGTEVAKDAADIILLDKDLGVLADGVVEGRRIFANTMKYVLMATSSNFGNMFSAAGASIFLSFLPMLPSQILLNNLLYDVGQMTIPTDNVDEEMLARPSAWDVRFIRRFMAFFGPISSIFDFATFGVMLGVLHAHAPEFRTGWFVESLATQALVIFVIRTRRQPFWRSRPSRPLLISSLTVPVVGLLLPYLWFGPKLGFTHLPAAYYPILVALVVAYLGLVEFAKGYFYRVRAEGQPVAARRSRRVRRLHRRASIFTRRQPVPPPAL
jgi:Mg2+-importing ATPase